MTPLEAAIAYASRGWRVHPIPPKMKHPAMPRWQENATTDEHRIRRYYGQHPTHGVCIATGAESGLFAIDIDPDDGGDDSLRALEAKYGPLPDTVMSLTGGGGTHYLLAWPTDGREIRNSASSVLGVGIDVRGTGGQIVVAPTVHPNGMPYAWEVEHDPLDGIALAVAPEWLLELLTADPRATEPRAERRPRPLGDPLPGDWWESGTTWPDELVRYGWALHSTHTDAAGDYYELWARPGKSVKDGASASLYYRGSDVLKVFTSNCPPLHAEETYTLWGFHVAMEHGGDFAKAASAVRTTMQVAAGVAAAPAARVATTTTTTTVACPHCGSTNTKEVAA